MRDVVVLGIGQTALGRWAGRSWRELAAEAALAALNDAGGPTVGALWAASLTAGPLHGQGQLGALLAAHLGLLPVPAGQVDAAEASGALALRSAWLEVAAGRADVALAVAADMWADTPPSEVEHALAAGLDRAAAGASGLRAVELHALLAQQHMTTYGTTRGHLTAVAVKNHANAVHNPRAAFRFGLTPEAVLDSPLVAEPLHQADVAEPVDGAAAVVLATREVARAAGRRGVVRIAGIGLATDDPATEHQAAPLTAGATHAAGAVALRMAGLAPADVELMEVHDVCTSAELLAIEALGLVPPGTAGPATADGVTSPDGRCPVNASGGLLGAGHAGAAAGLAQVVALVEQLRGTAGPLQVRGVRRALAQSGGGCGATSVVTVLIGED